MPEGHGTRVGGGRREGGRKGLVGGRKRRKKGSARGWEGRGRWVEGRQKGGRKEGGREEAGNALQGNWSSVGRGWEGRKYRRKRGRGMSGGKRGVIGRESETGKRGSGLATKTPLYIIFFSILAQL